MALPIWLYLLVSVIKSAVVLGVLLTAVAYTVWLERKVVGHMQNRWGPTRVGPFGLLQPAADGIKFLFKEDLTPPHVYKPLFLAAPLIAVIFALTSILIVSSSWKHLLAETGLNLGLLWRLLPALVIIFATGLADDFWGLTPWQKIGGQVVAAGAAFGAGIQFTPSPDHPAARPGERATP